LNIEDISAATDFSRVQILQVLPLLHRRKRWPFYPVVMMLCAGLAPAADADIFELESGGQVTGSIIDRGKQGEYVVQDSRGTVVTLSRRQVEKVIAQGKADLQYVERSRQLPDTVEAHRELAKWCKENRLTSELQHHRERILELDPTDEDARQSLGYQQHRGRWMTRDQIMAARGLKFYEGNWRTPQDIALREQTKQREQAQTDWFRQIRTWISWLDDRRSAEAAESIANVTDPLAAKAIVDLLEREDNQRVRNLLTATLSELKHPLAVTTLVDFSLNDPNPVVRAECLDYLIRYHQPVSLVPYVSALNDRKYDNVIINRAAEALHRIGDPRAISPLIDALVTTHSFRNPNASAGNINPSFGSGAGGGGGGLSTGGSKNKTIKRDLPNLKVRQALVDLSGGQDYEFDEKLWRMWFVNEQIHEYVDARRD